MGMWLIENVRWAVSVSAAPSSHGREPFQTTPHFSWHIATCIKSHWIKSSPTLEKSLTTYMSDRNIGSILNSIGYRWSSPPILYVNHSPSSSSTWKICLNSSVVITHHFLVDPSLVLQIEVKWPLFGEINSTDFFLQIDF